MDITVIKLVVRAYAASDGKVIAGQKRKCDIFLAC